MPARTKPDDAKPRAVPWTADLAARALGLNPKAPRRVLLGAYQRALADGDERLPDGAVQALIAAGYKELA